MEEPSCNNLSFNLQLDFPSQLDFLRVLFVWPVSRVTLVVQQHLTCPTFWAAFIIWWSLPVYLFD